MTVLVIYGTGYERTEFGYDNDGQISVLPGLRPRSEIPRLKKGCTGSRPERGIAPRNAPIAAEPLD